MVGVEEDGAYRRGCCACRVVEEVGDDGDRAAAGFGSVRFVVALARAVGVGVAVVGVAGDDVRHCRVA